MIDYLFLIRHGEAVSNASRLVGGRDDYDLTPTGRFQAQTAAGMLGHISFSAVYSSPVKRAMETAKIVCKGTRINVEQGFSEVDPGDSAGKPVSCLKNKWLCTHPEFKETFEQIQSRCMPVLKNIVSRDAGNVIIFSHADIIMAMIYGLLGIKTNRRSQFIMYPYNTATNVISFTSSKPKLVLFNYMSQKALGDVDTIESLLGLLKRRGA